MLTLTLQFAACLVSAGQATVVDHPVLTLEGARRVLRAAVEEARKDTGTGVIAIVDAGGELMLLERLDGTFAAGAEVSTGKARTAALFQKPTKVFEDIIAKGRFSMTALESFTPLQGGVPIRWENQIIGAIGVSGAASAQRDEEVAMAGVRVAALFGARESAPMPASITYVPRDAVARAFEKGMPLLEVGDYKIHASHREAPGQAEVHERDTDIVYVLRGCATLTTGGRVVDSKQVGPEEIRGLRIEGGESRTLVQGDVIVIPSGMPHWFEKVESPFDYYVVKVRDSMGGVGS